MPIKKDAHSSFFWAARPRITPLLKATVKLGHSSLLYVVNSRKEVSAKSSTHTYPEYKSQVVLLFVVGSVHVQGDHKLFPPADHQLGTFLLPLIGCQILCLVVLVRAMSPCILRDVEIDVLDVENLEDFLAGRFRLLGLLCVPMDTSISLFVKDRRTQENSLILQRISLFY